MKVALNKKHLICILIATILFPGAILSAQHSDKAENLTGYYSREGNNGSPSSTSRNNIYIKFFPDRWIAMLYIPSPYASSVEPPVIARVFEEARKKTSGSSYLRGKFGLLSESATIHIERYGYLEDRLVFECGSLAPCTIRLDEDFVELIKPGVINEHIIKYNYVANY